MSPGKHISVSALLYSLCWVGLACTHTPQALVTRAHDGQPSPRLDVAYVSTPFAVVKRMLQIAQVGPADVVYDLGAGDGRIVIMAAQQFGARAVGIDLDPMRIAEANENARRAGVSERVQFLRQDLFTADLKEATVVTLFLTPTLNLRLRPKLWRELKPGARVVAHLYDMGDWKPDKVERVNGRLVYYWVIPVDTPAIGGGEVVSAHTKMK